MKTRLLAFLFIALTSNLLAVTSYKYQQNIEIKKPGIYKVFLSGDAIAKSYPKNNNFKMKDPQGQFIPVQLDNTTVPSRVNYNSYNSKEANATVINIALNQIAEVKSIKVSFVNNIFDTVTVKESIDNIYFKEAAPAQRAKGDNIVFNFKNKKAQYFTITVPVPNAEIAAVDVITTPQNVKGLDAVKAKFTQNYFGTYTKLDILLPYNNEDIYSLVLTTAVTKQINNSAALAILSQPAGLVERQDARIEGTFYDYNKANQKELVLSLNNGQAKTLTLFIFDTAKIKVTAAELRILPKAITFDAKIKGDYTLFLGSDVDFVATPANHSGKAVTVKAKEVQGNPAFDDPAALLFPTIKACGFNAEEAAIKLPIAINQIGVQELAVPFDGEALNKIRILREGKEIPFIISGKAHYIAQVAFTRFKANNFIFNSDVAAVNPSSITFFTANLAQFLVNVALLPSQETPISPKSAKPIEQPLIALPTPLQAAFVWYYQPRLNLPYKTAQVGLTGAIEYIVDLSAQQSVKPVVINNVALGYELNTIRFYAADLNKYTIAYEPSARAPKYKDAALSIRLAGASAQIAIADNKLFTEPYPQPTSGGLSIFYKWFISTILVVLIIFVTANYTKKVIRVKNIKKRKTQRVKKVN